MNRILFLYYDPHHVHATFARSLGADFLPVDFKIGWRRKPHFYKKYLGMVLSALSLPQGYDVYLCEGTFIIPAISRKLHRIGNEKKIVNLLADPLCYYLYSRRINGIRREMIIDLLSEVDGFICMGEMEAELLAKITGDKKCVIVEPFIKKEVYSRLIKIAPSLESHNILFIAKGPDWFYKGMDLLIDSFRIAKEESKDLTLTVVGEWQPKKEWLIDGARFVGYQPNLDPYIRNSSLYVHLGRGESFGISILEAMLGGLPAIVSEWTGAKQVVKNLGSDFISSLDSEDAASKILKYVDLSLEKKTRLSEKSRKLASGFKEDEKVELFRKKFMTLSSRQASVPTQILH